MAAPHRPDLNHIAPARTTLSKHDTDQKENAVAAASEGKLAAITKRGDCGQGSPPPSCRAVRQASPRRSPAVTCSPADPKQAISRSVPRAMPGRLHRRQPRCSWAHDLLREEVAKKIIRINPVHPAGGNSPMVVNERVQAALDRETRVHPEHAERAADQRSGYLLSHRVDGLLGGAEK
jgi:hypothetical protein